MGEVLPMPSFGDLFADTRGGDRTMRVSYHPDRGAVVVSLWAGTVCRGSFRMAAGDVDKLLSVLTEIKLSVEPAASTDPRPSPGGPGAETAIVTGAPDPMPPTVEQTGDVHGTGNDRWLSSAPVPRVA
jgi:hypothetical protein